MNGHHEHGLQREIVLALIVNKSSEQVAHDCVTYLSQVLKTS